MANQQPRTSILHDWAASYKAVCNCERGNIQVFICDVETCEHHEQEFFCSDCVLLDQKHNHKRTQIKDELNARMQQWQTLTENGKQLKQIIEDNYPQHKPLLKYLDNESLLQEPGLNVQFPSHYLSQDIETFQAEFNKINLMMAEMETLFETKDLTKILKKIPDLIEFQKSYEKLKYLQSFKDADKHESFFYEVYEPVMKIVATSCRPFTDFKQPNNDSLFRLKWRWLAQRVSFNNQGPFEEVKGQAEPLNNNPQNGPQELSNLINLVKSLQDKIAHLSALNENKDNGLLIEANDKIKSHDIQIKNQEQAIQKIYQTVSQNQQENKIIGGNFNEIQNQHRTLLERISAQEKLIPPLDSRLTALEKINSSCDFPNSVTDLISLKLDIKLQECVQRLNNIEKMENEFDQTALKKQIMKLEQDNQDLKKEITQLQTKITEQKKIEEEVKQQKQEQQEKINSNIKCLETIFNGKSIHQSSSIITNSDENNKIINYFPADKRTLLMQNIYKGSRDGWSKEVFAQKVFNQGPNLILVKTKNGVICGGFTSKNWTAASSGWTNDNAAFVFNLNDKFTPTNYIKAIYLVNDGFIFGGNVLQVTGDQLNADNKGQSHGSGNFYNHQSHVAGEMYFTCVELEVYKVVNY